MDWTSEPVSQSQLNVVLIRVALVMVSVHSSKTLIKTLPLFSKEQRAFVRKKLHMVGHPCYSSTRKAEARGIRLHSQPWLWWETPVSKEERPGIQENMSSMGPRSHPRTTTNTHYKTVTEDRWVTNHALTLFYICVCSCLQTQQKRISDPITATMWLLGFELRTSGRVVSALNCWAISPAPWHPILSDW